MFVFLFALPEAGALLAAGVAEAFASVYEQYVDRVFRFVRYRISDEQEAQDITSTVFEKALTRFQTYKSDRASLSTWIFVIARNTIVDHLRVSHRGVMVELEEDLPIKGDDSPEETAIKVEDFGHLQTCLSRLSEAEQRILGLKFGAGLKNTEISRLTGLSESKVANLLFRAIRKLRLSYGGHQ
jgi:RNA polymerase sigma-70 factor, ECF subfamily